MPLDARLGCRKPPLHRTRVRIDRRRPRRHLAGPRLPIRQTPGQTRAAQNADLALRDVQPAPVLGCVVDLKVAAQPPGLLGRIDMIQARQLVRVPIVHHQHDLPVRKVDQVRQQGHEVCRGPALGDLHMTPAPQRSTHHEPVGRTVAFILAVHASWLSRFHRHHRTYLLRPLLGHLVHAHPDGIVVEIAVIDIPDILHGRHEVGILPGWNAPLMGPPRLQGVFLMCTAPFRSRCGRPRPSRPDACPAGSRSSPHVPPAGPIRRSSSGRLPPPVQLARLAVRRHTAFHGRLQTLLYTPPPHPLDRRRSHEIPTPDLDSPSAPCYRS